MEAPSFMSSARDRWTKKERRVRERERERERDRDLRLSL